MPDWPDPYEMTPLEFGRRLMEDDPSQFKAGYSPKAAALAAQDVHGLTDEQTAELRSQLENEHALFDQLADLNTRENSNKLVARQREWMVGTLVAQTLGLTAGDLDDAVTMARGFLEAVQSASDSDENMASLWAVALRSLETAQTMRDARGPAE